MSSAKQILRKVLQVPEDVDIVSSLRFFLWQRVLRINAGAGWPVHWTSRVVAPERVVVGRASYPGDMPGCYIQGINGIEIGDYCLFGPNVGIISANHDPLNPRVHVSGGPIRIGDFCWIGFGAVILPGVELGPRTTVGAGAVVTKSFPEGNCVVVGNPARVVRRFGERDAESERSFEGPGTAGVDI